MGRKRRDRLVGMTRFHDEESDRELVNTMTVEVSGGRVRTVIGSVLEPTRSEPVTSEHPAVLGYQSSVNALMRRLAYAQRPITSYWVPKHRHRPALENGCPECGGAREIMVGRDEDARMVLCPVCGD